jgi:hypothetical protein
MTTAALLSRRRLPFEGMAATYVAIFVFLHLCFLELLNAPQVFMISPQAERLISMIPYKTLLAGSILIVIVAFCWEQITSLTILAAIGAMVGAIIGVARITAGSVPSASLVFFLFFAAAPFVYRNGRFLLDAAAFAVVVNAIYATIQLLTAVQVLDVSVLPVIPTAMGAGQFLLFRPSGLYFQPTAAASLFGFAALIFRAGQYIYRSRLYGLVFWIALVGLLMTQAWAATIVFAMFYVYIFMRPGDWVLAAFVVTALTRGHVRDYFSRELYFKLNVSLAAKIGLLERVGLDLTSNPLVLLLGSSLAGSSSLLNQENTFLDLILQYGVVFIAIIYVAIIRAVLALRKTIWRLPLPQTDRGRLARIAVIPLYPLLLAFTQNSAFMPEVSLLLVLWAATFFCYVSDLRALYPQDVLIGGDARR